MSFSIDQIGSEILKLPFNLMLPINSGITFSKIFSYLSQFVTALLVSAFVPTSVKTFNGRWGGQHGEEGLVDLSGSI